MQLETMTCMGLSYNVISINVFATLNIIQNYHTKNNTDLYIHIITASSFKRMIFGPNTGLIDNDKNLKR